MVECQPTNHAESPPLLEFLQETQKALQDADYLIVDLEGKTIAELREKGGKFSYVRHLEPPDKLEEIHSRRSQVAVLPGFLLPEFLTNLPDPLSHQARQRYAGLFSQVVVRDRYSNARFVIPSLSEFAELFYTLRKKGIPLIPYGVSVRTRTAIRKPGTLHPFYNPERFSLDFFVSVGLDAQENGLLINDVTLSRKGLRTLLIVKPTQPRQGFRHT